METRTDDDAKKKVWSLIKDIQVAMMVSHHEDHLHGRPMVAVDKEFDGTLWFFTRWDTPKVEQFRKDPRVLLAYSDPDDQVYVSISGQAEILRDKALVDAHWKEAMRTWFPKGKDDPEIALIKVESQGAEYWDAPSSTMVYAYGYLKARLTGESPHPGDVAKVKL